MNAADTYLLLGAYAVDAVDETERAEVERYLTEHPDAVELLPATVN